MKKRWLLFLVLILINFKSFAVNTSFIDTEVLFNTSVGDKWNFTAPNLTFPTHIPIAYRDPDGKVGFVSIIEAKNDSFYKGKLLSGDFSVNTDPVFKGGDSGSVYGAVVTCYEESNGIISPIENIRLAIASQGLYRVDKDMGLGETIIDWTREPRITGKKEMISIIKFGDALFFNIQTASHCPELGNCAYEFIDLGSYVHNCNYYSAGLFSSQNVDVDFEFFAIDRFGESNPNEEELVATPEIYINTNSQSIFEDETLQVFFNTSVLAGMSEQYNVYFSINWDDVTLYDNGIDLVTDKQPLFNNIVVPELSNWFEYERLGYTFPEGVPQTDYVLSLHLVDNEDNVVFENFSSVSYFPEQSPFISSGDSKQQSRGRTTNPKTRQAKSSSKTCHLGGIRTDVENTTATELDKATKRAMLALQMGSSFPLEGRLKTIYQGVKGSYNLLKKGKKVCDHVNNFETLFDNYDDNIDFYGLSNEQASNIFSIEMLTSALSLTSGGGVLYSGFDSNDLVNGIKDYYNHQNKQFSAISSLDNSATIKIKFDQPFHWFQFATKAVKLKVTATPVFTYSDGYEFTDLKDVPKDFTNSDNIETRSIDIGEADSDRTSFGNIDYILSATLTRGLYLIKASTENGDEVFRDTIHVMSEGQEHTMLIDR